MNIGAPNENETAQMTRNIVDFARARTTDPSTAYAAMLTGGLQLAVADLGETRAIAMMTHLFGDMVDLGRQMLDAGLSEPFDDGDPGAGRGSPQP